MIIGLGIDFVEIKRIKRLWDKYKFRFASKILNQREIENLSKKDPVEYLASRFAAKEAGVKALGTGFSEGITFKSLWVAEEKSGRPKLIFEDKAAEVAKRLKVKRVHLSISHSKEIAGAVVIIET